MVGRAPQNLWGVSGRHFTANPWGISAHAPHPNRQSALHSTPSLSAPELRFIGGVTWVYLLPPVAPQSGGKNTPPGRTLGARPGFTLSRVYRDCGDEAGFTARLFALGNLGTRLRSEHCGVSGHAPHSNQQNAPYSTLSLTA
jgi:hypothetical protein